MNIELLENIPEHKYQHYGGKVANLAILKKHSYNVPNGIGLSKKVFESFLIDAGLNVNAIKKVHSLGMISLDTVINQCYDWQNKILKTIEENSFSESLSEEILNFLDENKLYAVRSSCISEDSDSSSFAGQYVSVLNVQGHDNILSAVKECWASQYNKRGSSYAMSHQGMPILSPSMGVVIQEMVTPDFAGVCFTAGPTPRTANFAIIEYVDRIGEALVSGEITPCHLQIDTDNNFKRKKISKSTKNIIPDAQSLKLLDICRNIENTFSSPQDIEWAMQNDEIYILQSRPITVLGKKDEKAKIKSKIYLSRSESDLQEELHEWVLSNIDISGFRAATYFLSKQNEVGFWSNPEIPEWDVVGTALAINLLIEGGLTNNLTWQDSLTNSC